MKTTTVSTARFKARCLALIDSLDRSGGEIVITRRGRPVAKVVPYDGFDDVVVDWGEVLGPEHFSPAGDEPARPLAPDLRGSILYEADDAWDAHPEWCRRSN